MRVQIEGVEHRSNGPLYDLEDAVEEFLSAVRRGLYKLDREEGDGELKISLDVLVEYKKPVEVIR